MVPQLREAARRVSDWKEGVSAANKAIADIEASRDSPTLVDLKDFIARASTSGDAATNMKKGKP